MYRLVVLAAALAACDLQPPPPKVTPPPTPVVTPVVPPAAGSGSAVTTPPPVPPAAPSDAGPAPLPRADAGAHVQVTQPCLDTGVRFAQLVVDNEKDPTKRSFLEQDRTRLVRSMSENCSRDKWPQQALDCFAKAATLADAQACSAQLKAP